MTLVLLSLIASIASAADLDGDGCEDTYWDANGACVASSAVVGSGVTVGADAVVSDGASVGADTTLGASVFVGRRATLVGRVAEATARLVGSGTVLGRRAYIDADHEIGADNTFGRSASAGLRLKTEADVGVGFATTLGDDVFLRSGAVVGSLVQVGDKTTVQASAVLARGVTILDSTSAAFIGGIIGPNVTIGADSTIAATARIRKDATLGSGVTIAAGARIGREVIVEDGATVGAGAQIRNGATIPAGAVVPDGYIVLRGLTFNGTGGIEDCSSGSDDDGDGLADCLDPQCAMEEVCMNPSAGDPWLVFGASAGTAGEELWISDGTVAGTGLLADINPSSATAFDTDGCYNDGNDSFFCDFIFPDDCEFQGPDANPYCGSDGSSKPGHFVAMGDHLYFTADDGTHGRELWRTDGTVTERLTDINPNGNSFISPNNNPDDRPQDVFAVNGDYLYFNSVWDSGSGLGDLYRYSELGGVETVTLPVSGMKATGQLRVFEGVLYVVVRPSSNQNLDLLSYDGVNPAVTLGVAPYGNGSSQGNSLQGLFVVDDGLVFHGYDGTYRVFSYAPNEPSPAVYKHTDQPVLLREATVFNGRLCGTRGPYPSDTPVCYDARPGPEAVQDLGPTGLNSATYGAVVGDDWYCFRPNVSGIGYRIHCTDGVSSAAQLQGSPDGFNLAGYEGSLYYLDGALGRPYRYAFDGSSSSLITSVSSGQFGIPTGLPGLDTLAISVRNGSASELRFYHPSDGSVDTVVIDSSNNTQATHLMVWLR